MMIIGKQFEGMRPKPPDKPLGNAVSTVRKLRARRNRHAMQNNDNFTGEFKTKNLNAPFTYTGQIKNGIPNGKGIAKFHDKWEGAIYEGEFKDSNMHGHGVYTWAATYVFPSFVDGTKYDGEWKDGNIHGHVMTYADGQKYDGEWKDTKKHGHGVYTYAKGEKYDGEWKDGIKHGHGVHTWANGKKYNGEYKCGNKWTGMETLTNETVYYEKGIFYTYKGDVKNGKPNGQGVALYHGKYYEGIKYDGGWKDGKEHGYGVLTSENEELYNGEYKDGNPHGHGVQTRQDRTKYDHWSRNDPSDRTKYDGEFKDGLKHGRGVFTWANGKKYDGEFKDNKMYGCGVYTFANGDKYDGEYKDGKQNGRGVYTKTKADGKKHECEWKDGKIKLFYNWTRS